MLKVREKMANIFLINGNKKTTEKLILKSVKELQKRSNKKTSDILKKSFIDTAPFFRVNSQKMRKGKRKSVRDIPKFIENSTGRQAFAVKNFKKVLNNSASSVKLYQKFSQEIIEVLSSASSKSLVNKSSLYGQVLNNKRYLLNFRW